MSAFLTPTAADERAEALHKLVPAMRIENPWRSHGPVLRVVFFVLTALAVAAFFGFLALFRLPIRGCAFLTAAVAIGMAERMIRTHRFFGTGVESSLWLCGTFSSLFMFPSSGKVEALLAFAAAAALSGWRLRNAFCGVLATLLVVAYIAFKYHDDLLLVMGVSALIAVVAAIACSRTWQRPSTDRLVAALAVVIPVAGYAATVIQRAFGHDETVPRIAGILLVTALVFLAMGIVRRDRALLLAATLSLAMAAIELRDLVDWPAESKLIAAGVVVSGFALLIGRMLRDRSRGFVVTPMDVPGYAEAIQVAGVLAVAPHAAHGDQAHTGPELSDSAGATDKSFGGAGAGGGF
jgi:hypothetical protein